MPSHPNVTLVRARAIARERLHRVKEFTSRRTRVVHQGIQRSGTNYLRELLDYAGYFVVNGADPARDSPRHKHFRWQDDKSSIVMDGAYRNDKHVDTIAALNKTAGFRADDKHVVLFKEPSRWLSSIYEWGLKNQWTEPDADFFGEPSLAPAWAREWDAYYSKWFDLAAQGSGRVHIVCYESLAEHPKEQMAMIHAFLGEEGEVRIPAGGVVAEVAHSRRQASPRHLSALRSEFERVTSAVVTCDWQRYV